MKRELAVLPDHDLARRVGGCSQEGLDVKPPPYGDLAIDEGLHAAPLWAFQDTSHRAIRANGERKMYFIAKGLRVVRRGAAPEKHEPPGGVGGEWEGGGETRAAKSREG